MPQLADLHAEGGVEALLQGLIAIASPPEKQSRPPASPPLACAASASSW
ncbi:MAG: hypothetical protein U1E35_01955 [Rhodospirillales bacterium]